MVPGFYPEITREQYEADPCPVPSLNSSTARAMISRSPLHAWTQHPKLNPNYVRDDDPTPAQEMGTAIHAMLLRDPSREVVLVEADNWRTKIAQEVREEVRARGGVPLLRGQYERAKECADAARAQLLHHEIGDPFTNDGDFRELAMIWRVGKSWCRARLDFLPRSKTARRVVYDVKTTDGSADPIAWARRLYDDHGDMQVAFYLRGLRAITDHDYQFRFITIEQRPPYAISVTQLEPASLAMAERKVERALAMWEACMATGVWPGYPTNICHVEAPIYAERQWLEREEREPMPDASTLKLAASMQAPPTTKLEKSR